MMYDREERIVVCICTDKASEEIQVCVVRIEYVSIQRFHRGQIQNGASGYLESRPHADFLFFDSGDIERDTLDSGRSHGITPHWQWK
jgi:hypothetical protein